MQVVIHGPFLGNAYTDVKSQILQLKTSYLLDFAKEETELGLTFQTTWG